jgi:hypothetical protein
MHYYKNNESLIATIGVLDLPEITLEQYLEAVAEREKRAERLNAIEQSRRPLTESEVLTMLIPMQINGLAVDDNTALRMRSYYPEWQSGQDYDVGYKVQHGDRLWRCRQAHNAIPGWEPSNAASLWEQVCESHTGAEDDPIPYEGNMALVAGLYYVQDGEWYRCIRDTGNPVYHRLEELVGLYVEKV